MKLPAFPVVARRVNDIQMELTLIGYTMNWNPGTGTYDVSSDGGNVVIRDVGDIKPPPPPQPPTRPITDYREIYSARNLIDGRLLVTVEFLYDDGSFAFSKQFILADGKYWEHRSDGFWWFTPDFIQDWQIGTLPPATLTPPPRGEGGGGNQEQY
ncbi:hypothetical protein [Oleiharenicola sp. Vm1]|uniref:hypothetical protein n=1 Tax=Oleiharenicola sp. Vm1 TaxID=3398393 RepID=UPI0039F4E903